MCETNENPKSDTSNEKQATPDLLGVGVGWALFGFMVGTLVAGPAGGIAFAVMWAGQAVFCAASGHEVDSNDIS